MSNAVRYTVFNTDWGYFGLKADSSGILGTTLAAGDLQTATKRLLPDSGDCKFDKNLFATLQKQIIAYFAGDKIDFDPDIPIANSECTDFARDVYNACRAVKFGNSISYSQLAARIGRAGAARAVGTAIAKNSCPLLIPCHRVIKGDGTPGHFSLPGGENLKKRLLIHEKH